MNVLNIIKRRASAHAVVLFMKGSPDRPTSDDSATAVEILLACGAAFDWVDLQADPVIRAFLPKFSASAQCPQLFILGEFIGGIEVIRELHQQGELAVMLRQASSLPRAS